MQQALFEKLLVSPREGQWLKQYVVSTTAGISLYRLPHRSVGAGAERVELSTTGGKYQPLTNLSPRDASDREGNSGQPRAYTLRGDSVQLFPTPDGSYSLRIHYYLRPGTIVDQQVTGTERGRITAFDATARTIVTNAVPYDQLLTVPAAIATGNQLIDVVRPNGSHEVVLVGATQTLASTTFTCAAGSDLSQVAVGDYVRAAEQTDWPQLPKEFHQTLCDATAASILVAKGYNEKAQALASKVRSDMDRFESILQPRIADSPKVLKPRYGILRSRSRAWVR